MVPELSLSTHLIECSARADTFSFYLTANTTWNISIPDVYCKYDIWGHTDCNNYSAVPISTVSANTGKSASNKEIKIYVTENLSYYRRWWNITVNTNGLTENIKIAQNGKPYLALNQTSYELNSDVQLFDIQVEIMDGFFAIESNVDWVSDYGCSLQKAQGPLYGTTLLYKVDFCAFENTSTIEREGIITFTQGNLSKTLTVKQAGKQ
jgi:hypothetical protein